VPDQLGLSDMPVRRDPETGDRPLLLVVGTGGRSYREYLLRSIAGRYRIHLFLGADPTWEREYATGWTVLNMAETVDADEMIAAARRLAAEQPLAGVLSWDEARVLQVAKVAAALGLPGGDPAAAMRCRDKRLTRQALAAAGVPQPRSVQVGTVEEGLAVAAQIGYPVVLKPRAMAASLGVVRVDGPDELAGRFTFARDTTIPGAWHYDTVLVEEYLTGPEISIDSAVHRGEAFPMFVARKDVDYPPYFEEVGHLVDAADPLLADPEIRRLVQDAHTALGFTDGMTHAELKLTPAGPKIVEVNGRIGGDLIPYLGLRVTGIDPGLAAAAVACGRRPEVASDRRLVGAVRFFYVDEEITVGSVEVDESVLTGAVDRVVPLVEPGEVVSPPPKGTLFGRVGYATAFGETAQACRDGLESARAALRVRPVEPAEQAERAEPVAAAVGEGAEGGA
jgi:glutathione synthase/RimK-type ligase-like ATP-grasp enzyme